MKENKLSARVWFLGLVRFLTLLSFALWLGGLAFFGPIAAPFVFRVSRAYGIERAAPEMVGLMLSRFGFIMLACGVLLLAGWTMERALKAVRGVWSLRLWWFQGVCSLVMLALAIYLTQVLMPQILALQPRVLSGNVAPDVQAAFDARHNLYSSLASVIVWTGLAALFAFSLRTALDTTHQ